MPLLTLAAARQKLWPYGPDKVPYPGSAVQQANFDSALNQVVEEFLIRGKWRNTMRKVLIPIYDGNITLPRGSDAKSYLCTIFYEVPKKETR